MLRCEQIDVSFDARPILRNVSLSVEQGEVCCLIGPSGSGKSTLLRVIAGLQRPDRGHVFVDEVEITSLATHLRGVGMVFQDAALFPHLDVEQNIGFSLRVNGRSKTDRRDGVAVLLDLVGLPGYQHRRVAQLSGGEQQRVAIARALIAKPRVLLLDEPFAALDQEIHDRLVADVREILRREHITALHVTHDLVEAATMGDRVVSLAELSQTIVKHDR